MAGKEDAGASDIWSYNPKARTVTTTEGWPTIATIDDAGGTKQGVDDLGVKIVRPVAFHNPLKAVRDHVTELLLTLDRDALPADADVVVQRVEHAFAAVEAQRMMLNTYGINWCLDIERRVTVR